MRKKLALKNIYRSWGRSVFIFVLIAAVTYSLLSNVMEYAITRRETEKAIELYDGVGTVEASQLVIYAQDQVNGRYIYCDPRVPLDFLPESYALRYRGLFPYERLDNGDIEEMEKLPYVTYTDKRYMTAGVSDGYCRLDLNDEYYYDFTNNHVIEATVERYYDNESALLVSDVEFVGGEDMTAAGFSKVWIASEPKPPVYEQYDGSKISPEVWTNGPSLTTDKSRYTEEFCKNLIPGERYLFITKFAGYTIGGTFLPRFYLTDHFTYDWCDGVWSLEGELDNYLETANFADIRKYLKLIETDNRTFDVVYTQNMGSIRYFADGTIGISEGRRLNRDDYLNGNNVCVISRDMAYEYGLSVGDSMSLKLGNKLFEQYEGVGAIAAVPERLSDSYTEVKLEIVGIFKDTRGVKIKGKDPCWSYSSNTVFVPSHLLNADAEELENHTFAPGEFSIVVEDVYEADAFLAECSGVIDELGLELTFSDGNWKEIEETFQKSKEVSQIKISVLAVSVLAATCFTVFLYVIGRKRDFAIMRVLGTSNKVSKNTILLPLAVITAAGVLSGAAAAWIYISQNIYLGDVLGGVGGLKIDTSVPVWIVVACVLAEILLAAGVACTILSKLGRKSPLVLLHGSLYKKTEPKRAASDVDSRIPVILPGQWVPVGRAERDGKSRRVKFVWRYVTRNIARTKSKSVLFVVVTALLISVVCQINVMHQTHTTTFEETEVVSNYAGCLNLNYISQLRSSGYVKDIFYKGLSSLDIDGVSVPGCITNNISRALGHEENDVEITYLKGYDGSVMDSFGQVVLMGKVRMAEYGYELGDTVYIAQGNKYHVLMQKEIFDKYGDDLGDLTYNEVAEILENTVYEKYIEAAQPFTIVGCVDDNQAFVYLPGTTDLNVYHGKMVIMSVTEAVLKDNRKAEEYREYGKKLAAVNMTDEVAFVMDTSKLEALAKNITLLELLYPIAILASVIIGAFLTCLIVAQTSKDIAIMRILGTSRGRTAAIIVLERVVLCLSGIALSCVVLFIMRSMNSAALLKSSVVVILYFSAVLAAAVTSAVVSTSKNILDLLQTKE